MAQMVFILLPSATRFRVADRCRLGPPTRYAAAAHRDAREGRSVVSLDTRDVMGHRLHVMRAIAARAKCSRARLVPGACGRVPFST